MKYEPVIGLEVHLHLKTKTKAFCGCATQFGNEPNTQTCPVCLGLPGSLPVYNKVALEYAIKVALALNCTIQEFTKFDRKNYFYPDLPKGYQISQYDLPLSLHGFIHIDVEGTPRRIGIHRVHMEEDAGKLMHTDTDSLVDFNRTGIPLLEIVSEPEIYSPQEAWEYLTALKSILEYLDVSDCDMEKGSLRCDANISLRPAGTTGLGTKSELKNMNSFRAVKEALAYEIKRQTELLEEGTPITQETRLWDTKSLKTLSMRTKEEAQDYRYFPEPDLPSLQIGQKTIEDIKRTIPELPQERMRRVMKEYNLSEYDAKILVISKKDADFAEGCITAYPGKEKKIIVNWLIGPLLSEANNRTCSLHELPIPGGSQELIALVLAVEKNQISNLAAKSVLTESLDTQESPSSIIKDKNLYQISDDSALEKFAEEVIKENPKSVNDFTSGKQNALMFLVGQVMKKSQGKANPKIVQEVLKRRLPDA
ncbi:MAG: Asp-tRNA(Asn)/Glu-tRNA(Gln) amidotransferase subunit GatB [Candidatus Omnitrophica bacterium]|nr:Asp-tRNA(Asn)/Glu-tRNA(Gln) amidotransferase subunit GatB [Candidatus Omnitrophota bacterium]